MEPPDFQDRMKEAFAKVGGQSAMARAITRRYGKAVGGSQQTLAHLTRRTATKTAQRSGLTPMIASIAGFEAEWLATGRGPKIASLQPARDGQPPQSPEAIAMDLQRSVSELVRAWLSLDERDRNRYKREIETLALQHREEAPDRLRHFPTEGKRPIPVKAKARQP